MGDNSLYDARRSNFNSESDMFKFFFEITVLMIINGVDFYPLGLSIGSETRDFWRH